jgi:hypothetical protein
MAQTTAKLSWRVKRAADIVRKLNGEELAQLVRLVPALREVQPVEVSREAVAEDFRCQSLEMRGGVAPSPDEEFIGGLTYEEYLNVSDEKEKAFWDWLFAEGEMDIEDFEEHDVKPDAYIPARQERSP